MVFGQMPTIPVFKEFMLLVIQKWDTKTLVLNTMDLQTQANLIAY